MKFKKMKIIIVAFFLTCIYANLACATMWTTAKVTQIGTVSNGAPRIQLVFVSGQCSWDSKRWFDPLYETLDDTTRSFGTIAILVGKTIAVGIETCPSGTNVYGKFSSIFLKDN